MSRHKDQREPRRRRFDDDPGSYLEQVAEPSYFRRLAAATAEAFDAEVLWFNAKDRQKSCTYAPHGSERRRTKRAAGNRGHSQVVQFREGFWLHLARREKDIFVHAAALSRSGMPSSTKGGKCSLECGQGKEGPEVGNTRLI